MTGYILVYEYEDKIICPPHGTTRLPVEVAWGRSTHKKKYQALIEWNSTKEHSRFDIHARSFYSKNFDDYLSKLDSRPLPFLFKTLDDVKEVAAIVIAYVPFRIIKNMKNIRYIAIPAYTDGIVFQILNNHSFFYSSYLSNTQL